MHPLDVTFKLNGPKSLTKENHAHVLFSLRKALQLLKDSKPHEDGVMKLRVRNWLFLYEEGESVVDIILDKGYSLADIAARVTPRLADTALSFEECLEFHEFLLTTGALDCFTDDVQVRVGSPGSEPTLYDIEDFEASIGDMVRLETWLLEHGRNKYSMILFDIIEKDKLKFAVLAEGQHRFEIPFENIKTACVLPFHPASKSVKLAKEAARKKAREGAAKKYNK